MTTLIHHSENSHPTRWELSPTPVRILTRQSENSHLPEWELSLSVRKNISTSPPSSPPRPPALRLVLSLVCMASPLPPFWAASQRNLLTFQATPGRDSGSISACLWPWSEGTPLAYWPACKLDLILATLSALTSVPARHLPLFNEQPMPSECLCFLWALLSSVCVFYAFCKPPVQYCFFPLFSHPD